MDKRICGVLFLMLGACGAGCYDLFSDSRIVRQEGNDERGGTGGGGGTGGTTVSGECIPNQTGDAIEDACGVFVSASKGSDSNAGTMKAQPVATLKKAIALAKGKPIYACADAAKPFSAAITLDGDAQLFGGLDCTSWKYVAGTKTTWTAAAGEVPLHVTAKGSAVVADFVIEAANATKDGGSSIAIVAEANANVDLSRCEVMAGDGMEGPTPEAPMGSGMVGMPGDPGLDGCVDTTTKPGGNGGALTCEVQSVSGGLGGSGTTADDGGPGGDGKPASGTGKGGTPQSFDGVNTTDCTNGLEGGEGLPGDPGAGATGNGSLSSTGFTGESGKEGATPGKPGQGGGGGGGAKKCAMPMPPNNNAGPSAGGGGSGGCGGSVGKGGGAGGASIAIVSLGATLQLGDVTITTKAGGKGGDGGPGQPGGDGGLGGKAGSNNGDMTSVACAGGKGGKGGAGGRGGGGRGGPSIGIAFTGDAPDVKTTTITAGKAGDGGAGDGVTGMGAKGMPPRHSHSRKGESSETCNVRSLQRAVPVTSSTLPGPGAARWSG